MKKLIINAELNIKDSDYENMLETLTRLFASEDLFLGEADALMPFTLMGNVKIKEVVSGGIVFARIGEKIKPTFSG